MKLTKAIFTAILVLTSLGLYSQAEKGLYVCVKYSEELNRFETWASHMHKRLTHKPNEDAGVPVISQTYYTEYADVSYKNDYPLETWESTPFEEAFLEDRLDLESWMSIPFETMDLEEDLYLEKWMSIPFETEEALEIEAWMTEALWE